MTFHPNMQTTIEGISVIGGLKWRAWRGAIADLWRVTCSPHARGEYVSQVPRLVVILGQQGQGGIEVRLPGGRRTGRGGGDGGGNGPLHFIPAGVAVTSQAGQVRELTHLDIHLDLDTLSARAAGGLDARSQALAVPRLGFSDDRLLRLAHLIAAECDGPGSGCDLYGDGLIAAVAGALADGGGAADLAAGGGGARKGSLTPLQLRRVTAFMEEHCLRGVRLQELADLAGLSPSYFCAAFKASTGMPPHKWQMRVRIERVKALLERQRIPLADAAAAAGFSDQAHLTRVFRQVEGVTPGAWLRDRAA